MNERGVFYSTTVELDKELVNVNLANSKYWKGPVHQFKLRVLPVSESNAVTTFQSVAVNLRPQGPASINVMFCGMEDAIVRAGYETSFFLDLVNDGGEDTPVLTFDDIRLANQVVGGSSVPACCRWLPGVRLGFRFSRAEGLALVCSGSFDGPA